METCHFHIIWDKGLWKLVFVFLKENHAQVEDNKTCINQMMCKKNKKMQRTKQLLKLKLDVWVVANIIIRVDD